MQLRRKADLRGMTDFGASDEKFHSLTSSSVTPCRCNGAAYFQRRKSRLNLAILAKQLKMLYLAEAVNPGSNFQGTDDRDESSIHVRLISQGVLVSSEVGSDVE
jgi:hypothetical protein